FGRLSHAARTCIACFGSASSRDVLCAAPSPEADPRTGVGALRTTSYSSRRADGGPLLVGARAGPRPRRGGDPDASPAALGGSPRLCRSGRGTPAAVLAPALRPDPPVPPPRARLWDAGNGAR